MIGGRKLVGKAMIVWARGKNRKTLGAAVCPRHAVPTFLLT
jgi:hypothetical protein